MTPQQRYAILLAAYRQYQAELVADIAVQDKAQRAAIEAAIQVLGDGVGMYRDRLKEYGGINESKRIN